jgi:hypothetical protein
METATPICAFIARTGTNLPSHDSWLMTNLTHNSFLRIYFNSLHVSSNLVQVGRELFLSGLGRAYSLLTRHSYIWEGPTVCSHATPIFRKGLQFAHTPLLYLGRAYSLLTSHSYNWEGPTVCSQATPIIGKGLQFSHTSLLYLGRAYSFLTRHSTKKN